MAVVVGCVLAWSVSEGSVRADDEPGFVALFNGKDFTGWRFVGAEAKDATNWKVADGVIRLEGGGKPHLASEKKFADFELRLEWRSVRDKYNSGLYVRSGEKLGSNQLNLAKGGEGAVIGGKVAGARAVPELQKPAGEWNEWRVEAIGDRITFTCNGKKAWEGTGLAPAEGYIGLQAEGAAMEYRNIRIREIPRAQK
jgi:hypothetical protein